MGDIAVSGTLNSADGTRLAQELAFLSGTPGAIDRPEIPPIPPGYGPVAVTGAPGKAVLAAAAATGDVAAPATASADAVSAAAAGAAWLQPGQTLHVPVPPPAVAPMAGEGVRVQIAFDPSRLELRDVRRGDAALAWRIAEDGSVAVDVHELSPWHASSTAALMELHWRVQDNATPGDATSDVRYAPLAEAAAGVRLERDHTASVLHGDGRAAFARTGTAWLADWVGAPVTAPAASAWLAGLQLQLPKETAAAHRQ